MRAPPCPSSQAAAAPAAMYRRQVLCMETFFPPSFGYLDFLKTKQDDSACRVKDLLGCTITSCARTARECDCRQRLSDSQLGGKSVRKQGLLWYEDRGM